MTVRLRDGVAGYAGLQHCGSVWACPVCSASILTHRALEIGAVLGEAAAQGHALGFATFTMRHHRRQPLAGLWDAAGAAWRRSISGKQWVAVQAAHGVEGWVRVWETTDGRNGWHVHVHFVVVLPGSATTADLDVVAGGMFERWSRGLVDAGLQAPRLIGQDWHLAVGGEAAGQLAEYLCKIADQGQGNARALGLELTHTRPGRARGELATRPVWSLLEQLLETGEAEALDRWHEWEAGSKGRRQVGWSKGLRQRFAPTLDDLDDVTIAEQEMGTAADDLLAITVDGWRLLVSRPQLLPMLLEVTEQGGLAALRAALDDLGVPYLVVDRIPA